MDGGALAPMTPFIRRVGDWKFPTPFYLFTELGTRSATYPNLVGNVTIPGASVVFLTAKGYQSSRR